MAKQILVHIDGGIGDIILATACVNALVNKGHTVDVCLVGDQYLPIELFKDWPGPRLVSSNLQDFTHYEYDYYFLGSLVRKAIPIKMTPHTIFVNGEYRKLLANFGFSKAELLLQYAKSIDPNVDMDTPTYCGHSGRHFPEITKDTVVIFPGCKKEYPMKKWDKFGELSAQFADVAVVGTEDDLYLANSIFYPKWFTRTKFFAYEGRLKKIVGKFCKKYNHPPQFAAHIKNYIGKLSLADTAALIAQAGLFIGNDGGLAHVAAALNVPTYIISGPTDPIYWRVKCLPLTNITKKLDCQPCFYGGKYPNAWKHNYVGCPIGMKCMASLSVNDVLQAIQVKSTPHKPSNNDNGKHMPTFYKRVPVFFENFIRRQIAQIKYPKYYRSLQERRRDNNSENYSLKPFDEKKCIFVHIPKCAGTSISRSLFGTMSAGHHKIKDLRIVFTPWDFLYYFKFTIIRNPWDRLYSAFTFLKKGGMNKTDKNWTNKHISQYPDFESFVCNWLSKSNIQLKDHFIPQMDYLWIGNNQIGVDFIGCFENLENDFTYITQRMNIKTELLKINITGNNDDYRQRYTSRMRQIVDQVYEDDIKCLGYSFDGGLPKIYRTQRWQ